MGRPPVRDVVFACFAGLFVGTSLSVGHAFYATSGYVDFGNAWLWVRGILVGFVVACTILLGLCAWDVIVSRHPARGSSDTPLSRVAVGLEQMSPRRRRTLFTLAIALLWVPAFLAVFPGNYSSDGPFQLQAFINEGCVDFHQPAAHTLFLAACFEVGNAVLGSFNAGLIIYCLIQGILLAFAMAFAADRLIEWKVSPVLVIILTLVMVLNPVVQSYAFVTTKDSLFAAFFLMTLVYIVELIRTPNDLFASRGSRLRLIGVALGMCLMRKQGVYVYALISIILFFRLARDLRLRFCLIAVIPVACALSFNSLVSLVLPTAPDSVREMLSVPSQQIARVYMLDYDSLTQEQLKEIAKYYDINQFEKGRLTTVPLDETGIGRFYDSISGFGYLDPIADPAKAALNDEAYVADSKGYLLMWLSVAQGHESIFADAFLWGCMGYLYPSAAVANDWSGISPWNPSAITLNSGDSNNQISNYTESGLLPDYCKWLYEGTWNIFSGNPVLMIWVSIALPFYVLLCALGLLIHLRQSSLLIAWMLPFAYWASLCLGPVVCIRYVAPFFYCIPFLLALPFLTSGRSMGYSDLIS